MTQVAEMDATQLAELEAKPWDPSEFVACRNAFGGIRQRYDSQGREIDNEYKRWHSELQNGHQLHPCVVLMLEYHRPKNVDQLCLEWAHVSEKDDTRIAYTRNDADGASNRQLVTSIGKYLARHWPHIPDHVRRDVQAHFTPDERVIVSTTPEMIRAVEDGPRSCMASCHGSISFRSNHAELMRAWFKNSMLPQPDWELHPYSSYRPDLGWSMAVRVSKQPDATMRIDGRALVYTGPEVEKPVFIRTYMRNRKDPVTGWSETDFALHSWLERNGYVKLDSWPEGVRLFTPPAREGGTDRRMPYMDGSRKLLVPVTDLQDICSLVYGDNNTPGGYYSENTSGVSQLNGARHSRHNVNGDYDDIEEYADDNDYEVDECYVCEDCGRYHHQDDGYSVHRSEDTQVCGNCIDNYQLVRGARWSGTGYNEYYISSDDAYYVESADFSVDPAHLPDGIVCDVSGDYRERDSCVWVESAGEYYQEDHEDVVCDNIGNYQLREDCVYTEDTEEYVLTENAYESKTSSGMRYVLTENAYESKTSSGMWFEDEAARDEHDGVDTSEEEEEAEPTPAKTEEPFILAA